MIPAEWFGWMHYKTDAPPTEVRPSILNQFDILYNFSFQKKPVKYDWMVDHDANPSATKKAYVPYSTTKPKIESWAPGKK